MIGRGRSGAADQEHAQATEEGALAREKAEHGADHEQGCSRDRRGDGDGGGQAKQKRNDGKARADREGKEGRDGGAGRRAEIVGIEPKLLAGERVERLLGIGDQLLATSRASLMGMPRAA